MKQILFLLSLVLVILLPSCKSGVGDDLPYDSTQDIREVTLLPSVQNNDGSWTYKVLLPITWEKNLNDKWDGIGLQISDGEIVLLYAAQNQNAYYWEYKTANSDVFMRWGHYRRDSEGNIIWASDANLSKKFTNYYIESGGKKYIGITFRDGSISPIVQASLAKLKAVINVSQTEAVTGADIVFNGSQSTASATPSAMITEYEWDFGDGVRLSGINLKHSYKLPGTYNVSLTVKDNFGTSDVANIDINVIEMVHPGDVGDNCVRFAFDYQNNLLRIYFNFSECGGNLFGKPNVFGNFDGPEKNWKLFITDGGLNFDIHHTGWGYIELPLEQPIMALKCGYSAWYDGDVKLPDFSRSNFDHLKKSIYFNGQDLSFIIYSSGQVVKGP